ncbi:MAG: hypothetical protein IJ580_03115 [Prevotella sp.]|nr:hypothetical protein [Prevotella sp.]
MTAAALKVKGTPMAPYMGLMSRMSREQKLAVVAFLTESLDEPEEVRTNAELIREKYKNLKISPEIERLRGCMKLTESEKQDERTQYILGL